jgi:hypothetical protein
LPGRTTRWTGSTLREIFTAAGGTHEDFGAYDRVMAAERRTAILVTRPRLPQPLA